MRHEIVSVENATPYEATHECKKCGAYSVGVAYGRGAGIANVLPFADGREEAGEMASLRASEAASKDALRLAALARCPRCGLRNVSAILDFALRTGAPLLALAVLGWIGGSRIAVGARPGQLVEVLAVLALIFGIRAVVRGVRMWSGSSSRVELQVAPHPEE
jgi:hypothetical protein